MKKLEERVTDTLRKRRVDRPSPQHPSVMVVASPDKNALGRRYDFERGETTFGRESASEVIDDPRLSKVHFRCSVASNGVVELSDEDSTNGTFVDGSPIREPRKLSPHAIISAGDTLLTVDMDPSPQYLPAAASTTGTLADTIVGVSRSTHRLRRSVETVAAGDEPVFLLGETGVGKEVAARAIHELSAREGPWVAVNCATIPRELADSMLFGHAKGAFTGAQEATEGFFVRADGGTLFLDEIGELPTSVQAKLLRVLETGHVDQLGGESRLVDVRVIAATHQSVESPEHFRADLHARLSDWILRIPPLRHRRADILPLFSHFAADAANGQNVTFTSEFAEALLLHKWPQNVRELAKTAQRTVRLHDTEDALDVFALDPPLAEAVLAREDEDDGRPGTLADDDARVSDQSPTRGEMLALVQAARGNVQAIAQENQWHRMQVYRWVKRYGIDLAQYR